MSSLLRGYNIAEVLNTRGWNAAVLPKQLGLSQRKRVLRLFKPDIAVLMGSRLPENDHALLQDIPYVYDLDDADFHDPKMTDRIVQDVMAAKTVVAGSTYVANWCKQHNPNTQVVWTGTPTVSRAFPSQLPRSSIVSWAQSAPFGYPDELSFVVEMLVGLNRNDFVLRLYGTVPEDAESPALEPLRQQGVAIELMPFMPYDAFLKSLEDVAVGLSPIIATSPFSRGKSFGKILAYLSAGVPIVTSDEADHGLFFTEATGVVSNQMADWQGAVSSLLDDPQKRESMAKSAFASFNEKLTTQAATEHLEPILNEAMSKG
jgi:glycosyltransferase involved in cell wall biosynthesis